MNLEIGSFSEALRELADRFERIYDVKCQLIDNQTFKVEDRTMATHLYRIAQEAINNAIRHGSADHISVTLDSENGRNRQIIEDNGTGLPKNFEAAKGMGINNMRFRANMIGAELSLRPVDIGGTKVICTWFAGRG